MTQPTGAPATAAGLGWPLAPERTSPSGLGWPEPSAAPEEQEAGA